MPRKKLSKGSFLFTSMVASAAIAPIITSQIEYEVKDNMDLYSPKQLSIPSFSHTTLSNQGMSFFQQHKQTVVDLQKNDKNNRQLTAVNHGQRESNVVNMVTIKKLANIEDASFHMKNEENEEGLEDVISIWPDDTVLSVGDLGPKVEIIQEYLKDIGYYVHDIDGKFGKKTFEAIKLYQKKHGLKIDGLVGKETITHIIGTKNISVNDFKENNINNQDAAKVYTPEDLALENLYIQGDHTVEQEKEKKTSFEYGDKGEEITILQEKLKEAGYYTDSIDGIYGSGTQQAIRTLQKDHSLAVDGIVGKEVKDFFAENDIVFIAEKRERILEKKIEQKEKNEKEVNPVAENKSLSTSTSNSPTSLEGMISSAKQFLGTPYVWGGTTPNGFDCSGFLVYIYDQSGENIPRTVADIWKAATPIPSPRRGDLVFFETYKSGPSHAGIYLGEGSFIHSGSSTGVTISNINDSYWSIRYLGARSL